MVDLSIAMLVHQRVPHLSSDWMLEESNLIVGNPIDSWLNCTNSLTGKQRVKSYGHLGMIPPHI